MDKIKILLNDKERRREIILYLVFGVLTTVVNLAAYHLLTVAVASDAIVVENFFGMPISWFQVASVLSWIVAVSFAYAGNKLFVFRSRHLTREALLREISSFFGARILSLILFDVIGLSLCVRLLRMDDFLAKLFMNILVVIFNYIASKLVIFKKKA